MKITDTDAGNTSIRINDAEFGLNLFKDLRGLIGDYVDHVDDFNDMLRIASNLHNAKERFYKMSFAKRGFIGVFMNLARKFDVVDGQMSSIPQMVTVELIDALMDMAVYALKFVVIIRGLYPSSYDDWHESVYRRFVGDDSNESDKS